MFVSRSLPSSLPAFPGERQEEVKASPALDFNCSRTQDVQSQAVLSLGPPLLSFDSGPELRDAGQDVAVSQTSGSHWNGVICFVSVVHFIVLGTFPLGNSGCFSWGN